MKSLTDKLYAQSYISEYFGNIDKSDLILDAGCGQGRITAMLCNVGYNVVSFDIKSDPFWQNIYGSNFVLADIQHMPFKSNVFNRCINLLVLEYVKDDTKAILELNRVLKQNGILDIHVANVHNLKTEFKHELLNDGHLREYDKDTLHNQLLDIGFKIINTKTEGFYSPILTNIINIIISRQLWKSMGKLLPERYRGVICVKTKKT